MRIGQSLTLLALVCVLAGPAWAQDSDQGTQPGAPLRLVAPPPARDRDLPETPAGIGASPLGPLDPSWSDALPKGGAALPNDRWLGTARVTVRALLPLIGPMDSPAARALARRLLLSGAVAPQGADPADAPSLVMLRAEAAMRLGAFTGAKAALDNFPADKLGEAGERLRIELAFAGNDITDGCGRVAAGLAEHRNVWWDQANIACQLLSGARDKAALSLDILHDSDAAPDPLFDTLVAGASGHAAKLDKHAVLTPLRATLWAASKRPLPPEIIAAADTATVAAFAGASGESAINRLPAAERAAALGAWPAERLAELYGKVATSDEERAKALADETPGETPQARAALFALAQSGTDAARRASALARFLGAARRHDFYFAAARMAAPIIAAIGPSDAVKDTAPFLVGALIAADRVADAAPWLKRGDAATTPLTVAVGAIDGARPDDKTAAEALASLMLRAKDSRREIGLFLMLTNLYGAPPASSALAAQAVQARPAAMPSAALWLMLQRAASAHRVGETLLASLAMAQDGAHFNTEPIVAQRVIASLRDAGFDAEARAIARDAAVAGGL